jgi:hypothetical protein|tara:strand:+ start:273 stop:449 length:177 start_codon:yes stop_codon:yes gene_type:complete
MKPYDEGMKAFKTGRLGNPYSKNTKQNRDWEMGFNKAYFYNLEKVKLNEQKFKARRGS